MAPNSGMKLTKSEVDYRPTDSPVKNCGNCSMIRKAFVGYKCTLVLGPIDPEHLCDEWEPDDDSS